MPGYRAKCAVVRDRLWNSVRDGVAAGGSWESIRTISCVCVAAACVLVLLAPGGCSQRSGVLAVADSQELEGVTDPSGKPISVVEIGPSESEGVHDFGYVEPKSKRQVLFTLANAAAEPMRVKKVKSGCECIYLMAGAKEIPSDDEGQFLVEFHAPKLVTQYGTEVVLFTSDPSRPMVLLSVRARIGLPLGFGPRMLDMGRIAIGEQRRKLVALVNGGSTPARLLGSRATGSECGVHMPDDILPADGEMMIAVTIRPSGRPGRRTETVTIETDSPDQPRVALPVRYEVVNGKSGDGRNEPRAKRRRKRGQLCRWQ